MKKELVNVIPELQITTKVTPFVGFTTTEGPKGIAIRATASHYYTLVSDTSINTTNVLFGGKLHSFEEVEAIARKQQDIPSESTLETAYCFDTFREMLKWFIEE